MRECVLLIAWFSFALCVVRVRSIFGEGARYRRLDGPLPAGGAHVSARRGRQQTPSRLSRTARKGRVLFAGGRHFAITPHPSCSSVVFRVWWWVVCQAGTLFSQFGKNLLQMLAAYFKSTQNR